MKYLNILSIVCISLFLSNCQKENEIGEAKEFTFNSRNLTSSNFYSFNSTDIDYIAGNGLGSGFVASEFLSDTAIITEIKSKLLLMDSAGIAELSLISNYGFPIWDKIYIGMNDSINSSSYYFIPFSQATSTKTTAVLSILRKNGQIFIQNFLARPIIMQLSSDLATAEKISCAAIFVKFDRSLFCTSDYLLDILARMEPLQELQPRSCYVVTVNYSIGSYGPGCPNTPGYGNNAHAKYEWEEFMMISIDYLICIDEEGENLYDFLNTGGNAPNYWGGPGSSGYVTSLEKQEALKFHNLQMQYNPNYVFMVNSYNECGNAYGTITKDLVNYIFTRILENRPPINPGNLSDQQIMDILDQGMSGDPAAYSGSFLTAFQSGIGLLASFGVYTSLTGAMKYLADNSIEFNKYLETLCLFDEISLSDKYFLNNKKEVRDDILNFLMNCPTESEESNEYIINAMIDYGQIYTISNYPHIDVCDEESEFYNWYIENIDGGLDYPSQDASWANHSHIDPQALPTLSAFNNAMPRTPDNHWLYKAVNLYPLAGGEVMAARTADLHDGDNKTPTENTCALRISIALNNSGVLIPPIFSDDNGDGDQDLGEADITLEGADEDGLPSGIYYFLRAEFLIEYCRAVFPAPSIEVTRQDVLDGKTPATELKPNQGIYMMYPYPGSNFPASGHCDFFYLSSTGTYRTVSGNQWEYLGNLYFWTLH